MRQKKHSGGSPYIENHHYGSWGFLYIKLFSFLHSSVLASYMSSVRENVTPSLTFLPGKMSPPPLWGFAPDPILAGSRQPAWAAMNKDLGGLPSRVNANALRALDGI